MPPEKSATDAVLEYLNGLPAGEPPDYSKLIMIGTFESVVELWPAPWSWRARMRFRRRIVGTPARRHTIAITSKVGR